MRQVNDGFCNIAGARAIYEHMYVDIFFGGCLSEGLEVSTERAEDEECCQRSSIYYTIREDHLAALLRSRQCL